MRELREKKGITLIALIITIVVLLILAGVAIGTLEETDIIGRAKDAASSYEKEKTKENEVITDTEEMLNKIIADIGNKEEVPVWGEMEVDGDKALFYIGVEKDLKVTSNKIKVQEIVVDFEKITYTKIEDSIRDATFSEYDMIVFAYTAPYIETVDFGGCLASNNDVRPIDSKNLKEVKGLGGITAITNDSFADCTSLEYIEIPTTVTTIEGSSFYECTSLTKITIPSSVTSIGRTAFKNLTEVTINRTREDSETVLGTEWIPESVTKIIYSDQTVDLT